MTTSFSSLLQRLKEPEPHRAWECFVDLYTPLLYFRACRVGLHAEDAADLVQDVFTTLLQKLPEFTYDPGKSFRAWLKAVTLNRWRDLRRRRATAPANVGPAGLEDVAVPDAATALFEGEYQQHLIGRAVEIMQADFQPATWKACWAVVVEGKAAARVAAELGLTVTAVYSARARVLRRLREELSGLLD
jgi:RNA polymerase sigma-70 factor (ECF subfamily)